MAQVFWKTYLATFYRRHSIETLCAQRFTEILESPKLKENDRCGFIDRLMIILGWQMLLDKTIAEPARWVDNLQRWRTFTDRISFDLTRVEQLVRLKESVEEKTDCQTVIQALGEFASAILKEPDNNEPETKDALVFAQKIVSWGVENNQWGALDRLTKYGFDLKAFTDFESLPEKYKHGATSARKLKKYFVL